MNLAPAGADTSSGLTMSAALDYVLQTASERDRAPVPTFPDDAITYLEGAGALAWNATAGPRRPPAAEELALVRAVARADASVGRIFDGHLNGVERLAVQAPAALRDADLALIRAARLRVGVWGADPRPGEGQPAGVQRSGRAETISGVKTFCSGAGGLHRALVAVRDSNTQLPVAVWVDLTDSATVTIDESWYRSSGLRASVSHRVVFERAPVLARLGAPGALSEQPWFARDALRTAATWAGMADRALDAALAELSAHEHQGQLIGLGVGRMLTAQATIAVWLDAAARAMDDAGQTLPIVALHARVAIADASRVLLDHAAQICGSHPFATGGDLDRARRDLELFVLQHRFDSKLARAGAEALDARSDTNR